MTTKEALQNYLATPELEIRQGRWYKDALPRITCGDGTTLSVQASEYHYSIPRKNAGPYTHVEVGFPSCGTPESWAQYDDDCGVFAYIPIELVAAFVDSHGGIKQ